MINSLQTMVYKAFGFTIFSDISLPEIPHHNLETGLADIIIKKTDLSQLMSERSSVTEHFVVKENSITFHVPEIATFQIRNGNEILVSPLNNSDEDYHRLYILGTCMGAILMQRKILPLHGSAIAIDGKAYAFVGDSGAGKSTLASAFLNRGYQLLSDDVIPVTISAENIPIVTPAYPQQKLWMESLNQFGMESDQYKPIVERETKFAVPVSSQFANQQLPLAGIVELIKTDDLEISITPITKMARFHTLFTHTYRNFFLAGAGLMDWHFVTSAKMVNNLSFYQLQRPVSRFTAHDLTELILSTISKEEKVR
ncbi:aldolase [Peribacillus psychrosaccharolyticus]|uniref:aldolase n=1 Tax=Peribacillus psychrosaccharolyticus TaxID=1407 RepID=UPI003D2B396B